MDVTTLVRKVGRAFGDTDQIVISNADIFDWLNEAQLKVVRQTDCLSATVTTTASAFPYTLPADFLKAKRVTYNNIPLEYILIDDLDNKEVDRTMAAAPPYFYYIFAGAINLYPADLSTDTTAIKIDYIKAPATIDDTADPIEIPINYHEDLVRFCIMRAHERNENYNAAGIAKAQFDETLGDRMNDTVGDDDFLIVGDDPDGWYP